MIEILLPYKCRTPNPIVTSILSCYCGGRPRKFVLGQCRELVALDVLWVMDNSKSGLGDACCLSFVSEARTQWQVT